MRTGYGRTLVVSCRALGQSPSTGDTQGTDNQTGHLTKVLDANPTFSKQASSHASLAKHDAALLPCPGALRPQSWRGIGHHGRLYQGLRLPQQGACLCQSSHRYCGQRMRTWGASGLPARLSVSHPPGREQSRGDPLPPPPHTHNTQGMNCKSRPSVGTKLGASQNRTAACKFFGVAEPWRAQCFWGRPLSQ